MTSRPWVHAIITLRGWWLPGDVRGFRSRAHRIHSSGDYRSPPPEDEHAGLRVWVARCAREAVTPLSDVERDAAVRAIAERLADPPTDLLIVACAVTHAHMLFRADQTDAARSIARAKHLAALRIGRGAGSLWARGAGIDRVRDRAHQLALYRYIAAHARRGASVWRRPRSA